MELVFKNSGFCLKAYSKVHLNTMNVPKGVGIGTWILDDLIRVDCMLFDMTVDFDELSKFVNGNDLPIRKLSLDSNLDFDKTNEMIDWISPLLLRFTLELKTRNQMFPKLANLNIHSLNITHVCELEFLSLFSPSVLQIFSVQDLPEHYYTCVMSFSYKGRNIEGRDELINKFTCLDTLIVRSIKTKDIPKTVKALYLLSHREPNYGELYDFGIRVLYLSGLISQSHQDAPFDMSIYHKDPKDNNYRLIKGKQNQTLRFVLKP
jgi:hypothetical protein